MSTLYTQPCLLSSIPQNRNLCAGCQHCYSFNVVIVKTFQSTANVAQLNRQEGKPFLTRCPMQISFGLIKQIPFIYGEKLV